MLRSALLLLAAAGAHAGCPPPEALRVELGLRPVRRLDGGRSTELRLVASLRNTGAAPLSLRGLRLQWAVAAADVRAPDLEFSCWVWVARSGGGGANSGADGDACRHITSWAQAGPPARAGLLLTGGQLRPGEALRGGAGGVIGAWHPSRWRDVPLSPDTLARPTASCEAERGERREYAVEAPQQQRRLDGPAPPLPEPPRGAVRFDAQLGGR